jgi:hypothetical protein
MSAFLGHVAGAALPVAIGLAVLALAARAVLWMSVEEPVLRRLAQQHIAPLCTWCLLATVTYAIGAIGSGGLAVSSLSVSLLLLAIGVGLRPDGAPAEPQVRPAPAPAPASTEPPAAPGERPPAPAPTGSLWANPVGDDARPRQGLWSR